MEPGVKPRSYDSSRRRAAAQRTRQAILDAAFRQFVSAGYAATTMRAIADDAGVAVDTVYASAGTKPALFSLLIETALSGTDESVPVLERDYIRELRTTPDAGRKLDIYAAALRRIHGRLGPLFQVWQQGAPLHPELAAVWQAFDARRIRNMALLVEELATTGALSAEWSAQEIADILWASNSAGVYLLLVHERGWAPARYERWLSTTWRRLFLLHPGPEGT